MSGFWEKALATMVGALFAFGLAGLRLWWEDKKARIQKFKTALFILLLQRSFLRNLYAQVMEYRDHPIRAYMIRPLTYVTPTVSLDIEALAFLLASAESELLNNLALAETKYRTVVALVEARNDVHVNFQERLDAAHQATQVSEGTLDDIRRIAGKAISTRLEQMTDDLLRLSEDAIDTNRMVLLSAVATSKRLFVFPKAGMFGVEDVPLSELRTARPPTGAAGGTEPEGTTK